MRGLRKTQARDLALVSYFLTTFLVLHSAKWMPTVLLRWPLYLWNCGKINLSTIAKFANIFSIDKALRSEFRSGPSEYEKGSSIGPGSVLKSVPTHRVGNLQCKKNRASLDGTGTRIKIRWFQPCLWGKATSKIPGIFKDRHVSGLSSTGFPPSLLH